MVTQTNILSSGKKVGTHLILHKVTVGMKSLQKTLKRTTCFKFFCIWQFNGMSKFVQKGLLASGIVANQNVTR